MLGSSDRGSNCHLSGFVGSRVYLGIVRPSCVTRIRSTSVSCAWLHLGTGILGMESRSRQLLLGSWHVGASAASRRAVDAWLLGLLRRPVLLAPRTLGTKSRLLRRHQLRLWIPRHRLSWRRMAWSRLLLQSRGQ